MNILRVSEAGSSEPGDIFVSVRPAEEKGIRMNLQSKKVILKQFGPQMEQVIRDTVLQHGIENIQLEAKDNGALDYTIRARVATAINRAV